jgi:hypothetical protein
MRNIWGAWIWAILCSKHVQVAVIVNSDTVAHSRSNLCHVSLQNLTDSVNVGINCEDWPVQKVGNHSNGGLVIASYNTVVLVIFCKHRGPRLCSLSPLVADLHFFSHRVSAHLHYVTSAHVSANLLSVFLTILLAAVNKRYFRYFFRKQPYI